MDREIEKQGIRGITILLDFHTTNRTMRMSHHEIRRPMWIQKIGWGIVRFGLRVMTGKTVWEFKKE